jgi:hypothetical protein
VPFILGTAVTPDVVLSQREMRVLPKGRYASTRGLRPSAARKRALHVE